MNENPVVVGVDGTPASKAALRYGAEEAVRLGTGLRLVHVMSDAAALLGVLPGLYRLPGVDARAYGRRVLHEAREQVSGVLPADRVSGSLASGAVADGLVSAAEQARLLVLGDQHRPLVDRVFTGSVLAGVAGRARTPVVAVPASWQAGARRPIVAAVKDCADPGGLVRRAFEIAHAHLTGLVLVHVWQLPTMYDDVIATRVDEDAWTERIRDCLQALVDDVRSDFRDVEVELRIVHGQPAGVLCEISRYADLMLLSRRPHRFPWGHLGAVGRTVLRESRCPVEVLPPAAEPVDLDGLVLEENGVFQKEVGSDERNVAAR